MLNKKDILSVAMCDDAIAKLQTRKNEIATQMEEKRGNFEKADVETRDALLKDVQGLEAEAKQIDADIVELNELRAQFENQERAMGMVNNVSKANVEKRAQVEDKFDTPEYRKAYTDYIKTGDINYIPQEYREGVNTGTSNVPIPTIFQGYVETAWEKYGKFSKLVNKTSIAAYLNIPFEQSADGANVHTEGADAPSEESITFGAIELKPAMVKKWISLTDELMAMSPEDFLRYIADELVYRVVKKVDDGIIVGALDTNGKGIVGIANNANTLSYTKALTFNTINEVIANLVTFDNLTVAMNPATFFDSIMGMTDLQGRPIYQIATDNAGKPQYFVNGQKIEFTLALPAFSAADPNAVWAIVGDFDAYRLNLPEGDVVKTLVDPYTLATQDKVRMIGRIYAAGNVTRLKHFAQVKKPASV